MRATILYLTTVSHQLVPTSGLNGDCSENDLELREVCLDNVLNTFFDCSEKCDNDSICVSHCNRNAVADLASMTHYYDSSLT